MSSALRPRVTLLAVFAPLLAGDPMKLTPINRLKPPGEEFWFGPKDRLSRAGILPRCTNCGSLERHRALRPIAEAVVGLRTFDRVLRFSADMTIDEAWFPNLVTSVYEGENHMDLQDTGLEDGAFDLVFCVHVLEHVADDRRAIVEAITQSCQDALHMFSGMVPETVTELALKLEGA